MDSFALVIPETINFTELVKNSHTTLSLDFQSKLIDTLKTEFTETQQQWYVANLYIYMHYHPTNDYPINLENVYKMIGFANKGNAMKTIKNNFTKNEDYKVMLFRTEKQKNTTENRGGHNQETIMLNIDTFKSLCMLAKTEKGKEIRKYYVKLENIHHKILREEMEHQKLLQESTQLELEKTQKQLQKISKLQIKRWYDSEPGDVLYALVSNKEEGDSLIKLGKSKNGADRETGYMTHNQSCEMFYVRKCYDCNLAEKVLFHILDKHRVQNNREWFEISRELAIYTIDLVCNFLDNFINYSEELHHSKLLESLSESLQIAKNLSEDEKQNYNKDVIRQPVKKPKPTIITRTPAPVREDIFDFKQFFQDKCELGQYYECSTYDIYGAYRLWSKIVRIEYKNELTKYLNNNFQKKRKYFKDIKTSQMMYIGFKVKPFTVKQEDPNNLPKYEEFILNNFEFGYNYKVSVDDLLHKMKDWFKNYPDYVFHVGEERNFRAYINRHFVRTNMKIPTENGTNECNGIWGLRLKQHNVVPIRHKQHSRKIAKIDVDTKQILEVFDSILMLRDLLKVSYRKINDYIDMKVIFDNKYKYEYVNENTNA